MSKSWTPALGAAVFALALGGCTARSAVNAQCALNSDCNNPFVCVGGACRSACNEDRDCPGSPAYCVTQQGNARLCVSPGYAAFCSASNPCPSGRACTDEGLCVPTCSRDTDCSSLHRTSYCAVTGQCALPGLSDAGPLAQPDASAEASAEAAADAPADSAFDAAPEADAAPLDAPAEASSDACNNACMAAQQHLLWPPNSALLTAPIPTLRFSNSYSAMSTVELCTSRACTEVQSTTVSGSTFTPDLALGPGVHFWRVRPASSPVAASSPVWEFFVPRWLSSSLPSVSAGRVLDVDGDGRGDLASGAPNASSNVGTVVVYYGRDTFTSSTTLSPPGAASAQAGALFGSVVSPVGDFDGDGYGDLLVTAPGYNAGAGGAWVFRGSAAGIEPAPSFTLRSSVGAMARFGASGAGVGDMNGDGYADVAVGTPGTAGVSPGGVLIYFGGSSPGTLMPGANYGGAAGSNTGSVLAGPGDLNNDGFDDLVTAGNNTYNTVVQHLGGRVLPVMASGEGRAINQTPPGQAFGASLAGGGDLNNDGIPDTIVGAPMHSGSRGTGVVWACMSSGPSGFPVSCGFLAGQPMGVTSRAYGSALAGGFDLTGDSFADVLVADPALGAGGAVYLVRGDGFNPVIQPIALTGDGSPGFGTALTIVGDYNADTVLDFAVGMPNGASNMGAVRVYPGPFGATPPASSATLSGPFAGHLGASLAWGTSRRWPLAHLLAAR